MPIHDIQMYPNFPVLMGTQQGIFEASVITGQNGGRQYFFHEDQQVTKRH